MRLIDADKLIDYFYYGIDDKPIIDGISDRKIIAIIKNQTTAYSVDKVVEELDSLRITGNSLKFDLIPYDEAIEIVKQGGVVTRTETIREIDNAIKNRWLLQSE